MALARLTALAQLMGLALDWGCRSCILQIFSCKQKTAVGCRSSLSVPRYAPFKRADG
jgi:hypothetical protein